MSGNNSNSIIGFFKEMGILFIVNIVILGFIMWFTIGLFGIFYGSIVLAVIFGVVIMIMYPILRSYPTHLILFQTRQYYLCQGHYNDFISSNWIRDFRLLINLPTHKCYFCNGSAVRMLVRDEKMEFGIAK